MQNYRVYVPHNVKKREIAAEWLLCCRPTVSKSLMVSVVVSKLGCSELLSLSWEWTAGITVKSCWSNRCCQSCIALQATCLCSSKTMRLHTRHVRLLSSCSSRHRSSSHQICGLRTVLIWTRLLQNLRFDAGACSEWLLSETSVSWNSVSYRLLVKSVSGRHRRHSWPVASATPSVCEGKGTPLWASSALKTAFFRATHDFQKKHTRGIFSMHFERR